MDVADPLYQRALLYLRAAGHDTGAQTRLQLREYLNRCRADGEAVTAETLLPRLCRWFHLPVRNDRFTAPRLVRGSVGYPDG